MNKRSYFSSEENFTGLHLSDFEFYYCEQNKYQANVFQDLQIHTTSFDGAHSQYNVVHRLFIISKSNFVDWTIQPIYANVCAMKEIQYK